MYHSLRLIRYIFLSLGVLFLLSFSIWQVHIAPQLRKLPKNFSYHVQINSKDNLFDTKTNQYQGTQDSITDFSYQSIDSDDKTVILDNSFHVKTLAGQTIIKINKHYAIDRNTFKHIPEQRADSSRDGYLFAPPRNPQKTFTYYHTNYDQPLTMVYLEDQELSGLNLNVYQATFTTDQTNQLTHITEVGITKGINLDVKLKIWVEPQTGYLVKYEDTATAYYYDLKTGSRLTPWNQFSNQYTNESVSAQLALARQLTSNQTYINTYVPYSLLACAIFCLIFWVILYQSTISRMYLLPIAVCTVTATGTLLLYQNARSNLLKQHEEQLSTQRQLVVNKIESELDTYANVLRTTRGFVNATSTLNHRQWKTYVDTLDLNRNYHGVQGIGYASIVAPQDIQSHIKKIQDQGFPQFTLKPSGPRDTYTIIDYIEPLDNRNLQAFGYDMYTNSTRSMAMDHARDTDEITMSAVVTLVQEIDKDIQSGFLMILPVYEQNTSVNTTDERREHLIGFVYSPFRAKNFINNIYNQLTLTTKFRIYNSQNQESLDSQKLLYSNTNDSATIINTITRNHFGQPWTYVFYNCQETFVPTFNEIFPVIVAITGTLLSLMLTILVYILISFNQKIQKQVDQKNVELGDETHKLAASKARIEAMLKSIGDGLFATDIHGKIILINDAFTHLLQFTKEEVLGKPFDEVLVMVDKKKQPVPVKSRSLTQVIQQSTNDQPVYQPVHQSNIYYQRKDQTLLPVAITVAPISTNIGDIGAVEVFRDITQEQQIDQAKSEFVSLASHQLRTPISAIGWYSEMLLDHDAGPLQPQQTEFIQEISKSNARMNQLVNSLLDVSRIDLGSFSIENITIDFAKEVQSIAREVSSAYSNKHITLQCQKVESVMMYADPQLLRIIILNLLTNAFKYTPSDKQITVSITVNHLDKNLILSVQDEGIGIPEPQRDKIFTKLFRADNAQTSDIDGTGLGLYLVKSILDLIQGDISFVSHEQAGTTFIVKIPLHWPSSNPQHDTQ